MPLETQESSSPLPSPSVPVALTIVPISLEDANSFVERYHRHNGPVQGAKFCIGVADETAELLRGVVIVGRPIARMLQDGFTLEVTRCCTDSCPNACSMLYNAARTAAFAQGHRKLVTYTLQSESTIALKAAGWELVAEVDPYKGKGWRSRLGRKDQLVSQLPKYRWETVTRSSRQRRIFPVVFPWKREPIDPGSRKHFSPPETLIFTGKGNQIDHLATIEFTARVMMREAGGFTTWDIAFGLYIELLKAQDFHIPVANPPTEGQVDKALTHLARCYPEQLVNCGDGGYAWQTPGE